MDLKHVKILSPTLLGEMLHELKNNLNTGIKVFNSKDCHLSMEIIDKSDGKLYEFHFNTLPEEFRRAIHDYTTRLSAEKLLIETALSSHTIQA